MGCGVPARARYWRVISQENVEVLRSGYAAPDPLTTFAERIAPDVEFDSTAVSRSTVFRGTDALRRFIDEGPWAGTIHFEPERFFDIDDERVLVFVRVSAIGQESVVPPLGLRE